MRGEGTRDCQQFVERIFVKSPFPAKGGTDGSMDLQEVLMRTSGVFSKSTFVLLIHSIEFIR